MPSIKSYAYITFSVFLLTSCQSTPQRATEWTYVGEGESNTISVVEDCQTRAAEEADRNTNLSSSGELKTIPAEFLIYSISYGAKTNKYFSECMNSRHYALEGDVDRLRKEVQESIAIREKRSRAEETRAIVIGDYVTQRFGTIVIRKEKSLVSDRVFRSDSDMDKPIRVLNIDREWVQIEQGNTIGWVHAKTINPL